MQQRQGGQGSKRNQYKEFCKLPKEQLQIYTPQILIQKCQQYKSVMKCVQTNIEYQGNQIQLVDFKFSAGHSEDDLYASQINFYINIRRGLTVYQIGNEYHFLRKGLRKFFDINVEQVEIYGTKQKPLQMVSETDQILFRYTFDEVFATLAQNQKISIQVLEKANGENAQITFSARLDSWVICSKNVAQIVRGEEDIEHPSFDSQRYRFTKLIGRAWFQKIQTLNQQLIKEKLKDHCLIGEYCGDANFQHVVKYDGIQLRFYALVNFDSIDTCVYVQDALEFIAGVGLQAVKVISECVVDNADALKLELRQIGKYISKARVETEGEGCVIYFCNVPERKCLSLGKMKTIEYRMLRKMREKCKNFVKEFGTKVQPKETILNKFKNEATYLNEKYEAGYDMQKLNAYFQRLLEQFSRYLEIDMAQLDTRKKHLFLLLTEYYNDVLELIRDDQYRGDLVENLIAKYRLIERKEEENKIKKGPQKIQVQKQKKNKKQRQKHQQQVEIDNQEDQAEDNGEELPENENQDENDGNHGASDEDESEPY